MSCMNLLNKPEIFLLAGTLIVIVSLVWVQLLSFKGSDEPNTSRAMGLVWTYLAIFFALVSAAIFIWGHNEVFYIQLSKGFLIWSFLMTAINLVVIGAGYVAFKAAFNISQSNAISSSDNRRKRWYWIISWMTGIIGLGFISFSLSYGENGCNLCAGMAVTALWIMMLLFGVFWYLSNTSHRKAILCVLVCSLIVILIALIVVTKIWASGYFLCAGVAISTLLFVTLLSVIKFHLTNKEKPQFSKIAVVIIEVSAAIVAVYYFIKLLFKKNDDK